MDKDEDQETPTVQGGMPTPKREAIKLLLDLGLSPNPARLKVLMPVSVTVDSVKKAPRQLKRQLFEHQLLSSVLPRVSAKELTCRENSSVPKRRK